MTTATIDKVVTLPSRGRGRPSPAAQTQYDDDVLVFCGFIRTIASRLDFTVGSRGWCYLLEQAGAIDKTQFDAAQTLINDCRKDGRLPLDICADDSARAFQHIERLDDDDADAHAALLLDALRGWVDDYLPFSYWDDKPVYIQMLVEKADLIGLFSPVCERYHVPLANARGRADLNQRADAMRRFKEWDGRGKQCVLLYCGDFDPSGVQISGELRQNFADLSAAVGWTPDNLLIDRFGLNYDFIEANRLTWIDNLQTGNPNTPSLDNLKHPDHQKPYVQTYIQQYGVRKVEANALVARPREGRQLCEGAILRWLGNAESPEKYEARLAPYRRQLSRAVRGRLGDW